LAWLTVRPGWKLLEERRDGARASFAGNDPLAVSVELKRLLADGVPVIEFRRAERRLEDAFVNILRTGARTSPGDVARPEPPIIPT
jgi:ABC-2 type transport system ATP-binding protein